METKISILTLAISTISMLIALGQLMIALPKAQPKNTAVVISCHRISRPSRFLMILLILNAFGGAFAYWFLVKEPTKLDIYMLVISMASGAMGYATLLARTLVRDD